MAGHGWPRASGAEVAEVRDVLGPLGFADAKVSMLSGASGQSVNVQEQVVEDPIETIRTRWRRMDAVPTTPTCSSARDGDGGGTFTFSVPQGVQARPRQQVEHALARDRSDATRR